MQQPLGFNTSVLLEGIKSCKQTLMCKMRAVLLPFTKPPHVGYICLMLHRFFIVKSTKIHLQATKRGWWKSSVSQEVCHSWLQLLEHFSVVHCLCNKFKKTFSSCYLNEWSQQRRSGLDFAALLHVKRTIGAIRQSVFWCWISFDSRSAFCGSTSNCRSTDQLPIWTSNLVANLQSFSDNKDPSFP